jgi:hypothetical protein
MGDNLKTRLQALERERTAGKQTGGVVTYGPNETQDEALERARLEGITGPVLLVPEVMTYEEWAAMMEREAK